MKKKFFLVGAFLLSLGLTQSPAQFGPGGGVGNLGMRGMPKFDARFAKIFGDNSAFAADVEIQTAGGKTDGVKAPGKFAFLEGKTRIEIDMTAAAGGKISADSAAQMKAMGMDRMIMISVPEKKVTYMLYPGMEAYIEMEAKDAEDPKAADKFKIDISELGKETLDGRACVKNKVVVTPSMTRPGAGTTCASIRRPGSRWSASPAARARRHRWIFPLATPPSRRPTSISTSRASHCALR